MRRNLAKNRRLRAIIGLLGVSTVLGFTSKAPAQQAPAASTDPIILGLLEAHNQERAKAGLGPLKLDPKLMEAAQAHARDMAGRSEMSHEGSDGSTPQQRIIKAGYHYLLAAENVAWGDREVSGVMETWMESPPHKKNVLGDFTEVGLARAVNAEGKPYWCADFGKPIPVLDKATVAVDLLKLINAERAAAKLTAMSIDPKLAKHAQDQAAMLARKKGEPGVTATLDGIDEKLYRDLALSTGGGYPTPEDLIKDFMAKADFKGQLLGNFSKAGIGYANAEDGTPFWCIVLGLPARR